MSNVFTNATEVDVGLYTLEVVMIGISDTSTIIISHSLINLQESRTSISRVITISTFSSSLYIGTIILTVVFASEISSPQSW